MPQPPSSPKLKGELAEVRFLLRATELGFRVAKPYGESAPYDFIVERHGVMKRVQVRSTSCEKPKHRADVIQTKRRRSARVKNRRGRWPRPRPRKVYRVNLMRALRRRYQPTDFDVLAIYVVPERTWYLMPAERAMPLMIDLPFGPNRLPSRFDQFREAWSVLHFA
jgi:hypothetical protein